MRLRGSMPQAVRHDEHGFGLVEMMIALVILAVGITSVTGLLVTGHLALRRATQADAGSVLADRLLERFRAETWATISSSATLFSTTDSVYKGDSAYNAATAVLDSTGTCSGSSPSLPIACYPSRSIPDANQTPTEVAPDGGSYRIDTYVNWGCYNGTAPTDMSTTPPTCTSDGTTTGTVQPYGQVKIVTIVVRNASNLSGAPVYRVATTFDRLSGGSMPTVTVSPTTPGSTTSTTTSTTPTSAPAPPTAVTLANGGGTGNAYIDSGNASSLNFDVTLPATAQPTDTITLVVSDGNSAHTITKTATASSSPVHFTGINGQGLGDGTITFSVTESNSYGSSAATTSTATKDTVAPAAPTSVSLQNGQGAGSAYINSSNKSGVNVNVGLGASSLSTDSVSVTLTSGASTTPATAAATAGAGTVLVSGINASSLTDGTVTASATAVDAAGNASTAATASFPMDTVAVLSASYTDKNNAADVISGTSEANAKLTVTETSPASATWGPTTLGTSSFSQNVATIAGSNNNKISYSYTVSVTDQAGNTKSTVVSGQDSK